MAKIDVRKNLAGYYENSIYLPDVARYGAKFNGYKTSNRELLFCLFVVEGYDISFSFSGKKYYLRWDGEKGAAVTDEHYDKEYAVYPSANELLQQYQIGGRPLAERVDELEDMEAW